MASHRLPSVEEALNYAVGAIQRSDRRNGQAALQWVLQRDPNNVVALLWMSRIASNNEAQRLCLERVSSLNPYSR